MLDIGVADRPIYTAAEAARYAKTSAASVARWRAGYSYPTASGRRWSAPLTGGPPSGLLSFYEVLEVAAVAAARRAVPMNAIRRAVDAARAIYQVERPLMLLDFKHDGRDLFIREVEQDGKSTVLNLTRAGQIAWKHVEDVLKDLDYEQGKALRWWPAGRDKPIVIDPRVSFGRPYINRKGISTDAIRSRFAAGESIYFIADDLDVTEDEAQAAIRFELPAAA